MIRNDTKDILLGFLSILLVIMVAQNLILRKALNKQRETSIDYTNFLKVDLQGVPFRGTRNASVALVAFSDPACPACSETFEALERLLKRFPNEVSLYHKYLPLGEQSLLLGNALAAAENQDRYWEMAAYLYEQKRTREELITKAEDLGMDSDLFAQDLSANASYKKVSATMREARAMGIDSIPTILVNGIKVTAPDYRTLESLIRKEINR